jgi:preprotein translocase subunit SecB
MENDQGSIRILHVVLLESHFRRVPNVVQDDQEQIGFSIQVTPNVDSQKQMIISEVMLDMNSTRAGDRQFEARIRMAGIFEFTNLSQEMQTDFSKINGPAIVFPFIREHLMSLSQKGGIKPITINPVNFVELAKRADSQPKGKVG